MPDVLLYIKLLFGIIIKKLWEIIATVLNRLVQTG